MQADIVVMGCGIAGFMAAVAAARMGRRVLEIDEAGYDYIIMNMLERTEAR